MSDLLLGDRFRKIDRPLLHAAGAGDQDDKQPPPGQRDKLDVADCRPRERRVLNHRDLPGELGEQPHGPGDHVVDVICAREKGLDGAALRRRQRLYAGQAIHKQAVTLVCWHAARARVRLGDVSLLLKHGHVVADGGR